jgi:hypothetical protein
MCMSGPQNPKVFGAFLIGFAMIAGAYLLSNFGEPRSPELGALKAVAKEAPARVFIPVSDSDTNGLEDWRDQFISAPAVSAVPVTADDYVPPTTLTGQLGVSLMEGLIVSAAAAPVTRPREQVIADTVERLGKVATADTIFDVKDILISDDMSDQAIRSYGNALADVLLTQSVPELENELLLLRDYLESTDGKDPSKLITLANVYKNYRDKTLNVPVPKYFVKEHLDLINVYHALYMNIDSMTKVSTDPMLPFVRLKRYEDDVNGLALALTNVYNTLTPYARVFEMNDPAIMFVNFYQNAP